MKLAVTYDNGEVFQHFGHTQQFKVYDIENGKVVSSGIVGTNGSGHGALAGVLQSMHVSRLICGGIGGGAQTALAAAGIELLAGVSGDCDRAVEQYLGGTLVFSGNANCSHHDGESGGAAHRCGDHGCESHGCGESR